MGAEVGEKAACHSDFVDDEKAKRLQDDRLRAEEAGGAAGQ
jgi:hypothetical protein